MNHSAESIEEFPDAPDIPAAMTQIARIAYDRGVQAGREAQSGGDKSLRDAIAEAKFWKEEAAAADDTRGRIKNLLSEFSTYPCSPNSFSINDHQFVDFEFWPRLVSILGATTE